MKVICISGKAQHGKDTSAGFMYEILQESNQKVVVTHYADLVKFVCTKYFGWDGNKDLRGRQLLQRIGTDVVRAQCPNFWVDFVTSILKMFDGEWDYVLIPDTRFPNEINVLRDAGFDVTHVRVERAVFNTPLTEEQQNHPSETALDDATPDAYIYNYGGIEELREAVEALMARKFGVVPKVRNVLTGKAVRL